MRQVPSLQETIAKGRRHYYDGVTFRNWKLTMVKMYGGDTRPFLDNAWSTIIEEAQSKVRPESPAQIADHKRIGAGTPAARRQPMTFLGQLTMLALNAAACVMLLGASLSRLPFPYYTRLRWICFAAFAYTAIWRMKDRAAIICLPLACLFNPFFPFHLTRGFWIWIDALSFLLLLAMSSNFLANPKNNHEPDV
jgi:hypothetical protein